MNTVTYRSLALGNARREIGVREEGGNNKGPRVEWYQTFDSLPGEGYAWCDSFTDAMFETAGRPLVELRRSASVDLTLQLAEPLGWVFAEPQPGDLVVFTFSHIGFVDEVHGDSLITIEGNTGATGAVSDSKVGGDGVWRKRRSTSLVRAYIRVPGSVKKVAGKYPAAVLVTRRGYFAWAAWRLGEGDWRGYEKADPAVRPNVPHHVSSVWWLRFSHQLALRHRNRKES